MENELPGDGSFPNAISREGPALSRRGVSQS